MDASFAMRTLDALGSKTLPILPGDMLFFRVTGHRLLVASASEQVAVSGSVGQHVVGIMSATRAYWLADITIDWIGHGVIWSIHRTL